MAEELFPHRPYSDVPPVIEEDQILPREATRLPSSAKSKRHEIAEFLRKSLARKRTSEQQTEVLNPITAAGQVPQLNPVGLAAQYALPYMAPVLDPLKSAVLGGAALPAAGWGALGAGVANALGANIKTDIPSMIGAMTPKPTTPEGAEATEAMGALMRDLKIPDFSPTGRISPRPLLTPQDAHVLGARGINLGREIGNIPSDYAAAQAGQTRIGPLGQPTLGAKLSNIKGALTDLGDYPETGFRPAFAGVGDIIDVGGAPQPSGPTPLSLGQNTYAVRTKGNPIVTPNLPPGISDARLDVPRLPIAEDVTRESLERHLVDQKLTDETAQNLLDLILEPPTFSRASGQFQMSMLTPTQATRFSEALSAWTRNKINTAYPDAPNYDEAQEAYRLMHAGQSPARMHRQLYDEFITSPEGQQLANEFGVTMPSTAQLEERLNAADKWINSQLSNYIRRQLGTEGEPLVDLARQGFTILPREKLSDVAEAWTYGTENITPAEVITKRRELANLPTKSKYEDEFYAKTDALNALKKEISDIEAQRNTYRNQALQLGLPDPADLPEYAALTNPLRTKLRDRDKLEDDIKNIEDAIRVEILHDASIGTSTAAKTLQKLHYPSQQLYPSLTKAPPTQQVYTLKPEQAIYAGFANLARALQADVVSGRLPIEQLPKLTVEKYVRDHATIRKQIEAALREKEKNYLTDAQAKLQTRLELIPPQLRFGNAGVLEITPGMGNDLITQLVSEDTTVLDHCVGQGGSGSGTNKFTNKNKQYEPLRDIITGEPNPHASGNATSYIYDVINDDGFLASLRDLETGYPVGTIQFKKRQRNNGPEFYVLGYVSGVHNDAIDSKYKDALRDYLNVMQNSINYSGSNLKKNGVFDLNVMDDGHEVLHNVTGHTNFMPVSELRALMGNRFATQEDVKAAIDKLSNATPVAQSSAPQSEVLMPVRPEIQYRAFYDLMGGQGFDDRNSIPTYETIVNGAWQEGREPLENATNIAAVLAHMHYEMRDDGPLGGELGRNRLGINEQEHRQLRQDIDAMMSRMSGQFPDMQVNQDTVTITQPEVQRILTALTRNEPIPGPYFEGDFGDWEPDPAHPANQPANQPARQIANFDAEDMARNLIEDARIDNQNFDIPSLRNRYEALETQPTFFQRIGNLPFADQREAGQQVREALARLVPALIEPERIDRPQLVYPPNIDAAVEALDIVEAARLPNHGYDLATLRHQYELLATQPESFAAIRNLPPASREEATEQLRTELNAHMIPLERRYRSQLETVQNRIRTTNMQGLRALISSLLQEPPVSSYSMISSEERQLLARSAQNRMQDLNNQANPDNDIPFARGGLAAATDRIMSQLQANGMPNDKAMTMALRMANELQKAQA